MKGMFGFLSILLALGVVLWLSTHAMKSYTGDSAKQIVGAKQRAENVAARVNVRQLNEFVNQYRMMHPGQPVTMEKLKQAGMILPECPPGGEFVLEGGRIVYKGPQQ